MNLAVGDALLAIAGVFRGLGIINSKFVGAPNRTSTPYCAAYTVFLDTVAHSCILTLLPLTIDRAVAILLPLRYSSIITKKTCAFMFGATWAPVFGLMLFYVVSYTTSAITVTYLQKYHRCVIDGGIFGELYEEFVLIIAPFLVVIFLYVIMLFVVIRRTDLGGRFLLTASMIITTNLLAYLPSVIIATWNISFTYEVSQVLTVTLAYINTVINPVIYFATHPKVQEFGKTWMTKKTRPTYSTTQQTASRSGIEPSKSRSNAVVYSKSSPGKPDTVCLSRMDIEHD